jgi:hypothetical protein
MTKTVDSGGNPFFDQNNLDYTVEYTLFKNIKLLLFIASLAHIQFFYYKNKKNKNLYFGSSIQRNIQYSKCVAIKVFLAQVQVQIRYRGTVLGQTYKR